MLLDNDTVEEMKVVVNFKNEKEAEEYYKNSKVYGFYKDNKFLEKGFANFLYVHSEKGQGHTFLDLFQYFNTMTKYANSSSNCYVDGSWVRTVEEVICEGTNNLEKIAKSTVQFDTFIDARNTYENSGFYEMKKHDKFNDDKFIDYAFRASNGETTLPELFREYIIYCEQPIHTYGYDVGDVAHLDIRGAAYSTLIEKDVIKELIAKSAHESTREKLLDRCINIPVGTRKEALEGRGKTGPNFLMVAVFPNKIVRIDHLV